MQLEQEPQRWCLSTESKTGPELLYQQDEGRWVSTFRCSVDLDGHPWEITLHDPKRPGLHCEDPVLDGQVSFHGFEAAELDALLALEDATEILMAAVRAHGIRLEEGTLTLRHPGFIPEPTELLEDAQRLRDLLQSAAGSNPADEKK